MLRKILSLFFVNDTQEDDVEKNNTSPISKRNLEKESQTACKFKNIELLTEQINDFNFAGFRSVLNFELQFKTDFGEPKALLTIKFLYQQAHREFDVVLRFEDPQSLRFDSPAATFDISLGIEDISNLKWDDMKFTVDDYEEGNLSFYCVAIEVVAVGERCTNRTTERRYK